VFASAEEWRKQLTLQGIQRYLREHVKLSLTREFPVALAAFEKATEETKIGLGHWALVRMLFPYVETLGLLYTGEGKASDAVAFMEEYMGRREGKWGYVYIAPVVYSMYRHGLTHTHMPKMLERADGVVVAWKVTFAKNWHLMIETQQGTKWINFSHSALYDDLVAGLEHYAGDFDDSGRAPGLRRNFEAGFLRMATIERAGDLKSMRAKVEDCLNKHL
jgi:hypothetical protein